MKYPIVYDQFTTNFETLGDAVLHQAQNTKIREVINGEYLLTLLLPRNDPKWQYIKSENFIKVDGQLFRIRTFDEIRDSSGKLTSNIQCEHVYYDANDCKFISYRELIGVTPKQVLETAFQETRFTIGTVEIETLTDIFLGKVNPTQVVNKLIENVGGELIRDNWTVHLVKRRGKKSGVQFRIGKNITSIKRQTDSKSLVTRLYPYGKDDLDIYTVNEGLTYIDSPFINNYDRPHIGTVEYKDIEQPFDLLTKAWKEFSTEDFDGIDKPQVTYSAEIVELKKLKEYGEYESFELGDEVRVIDESLNINTLQHITEYEYYPFEPQRSRVVLINYSTRFYRDKNLGKMLSNFLETSKTLSYLLTDRGDINSSFLDNIRGKLSSYVNGMLKKIVMHDHGDMWVDNLQNPTRAMAIISGMFAIANSKNEDGDWEWKSFGDGDGFIADLLVAGKLIGGKVHFDLDNGTFLIGNSDSDYLLYYDGSKLLLNTEQFNSRVAKDGVISAINQSPEQIQIAAEKVAISGDTINLSGNTTVKVLNGNTYSFDGNNFTLKNKNNTTTISADGIVQSYSFQVDKEGEAVKPIDIKFYIDPNTISVQRVLLSHSLLPFRATSTGAASGGGSTITSAGGGGGSGTSSNIQQYYEASTLVNYNETFPNGYITLTDDMLRHSHTINYPSHAHSVSTPEHTHPISYGIYEGGTASYIELYVDGVHVGQVWGSQINTDLSLRITTPGWHTITLQPNELTRISANVFVKSFVNGQ